MPGRNEPCPCGSGRKFKQCCMNASIPSAGQPQPVDVPDLIACFEDGNFPQAISLAEMFLKQHPREPVAWQVLGVSRYYLGDLPGAEQAFTHLVRYDANNPDALNNLGLVLFEQGRAQEALPYCEKALQLAPGMPGAHNNLGNIFRTIGDFNTAEEHYLSAIQSGMQTPEVYCNLGTVQQEKGDHAAAQTSFETALKLDPQFAAACNNLGAILLLDKHLPEALQYLERARQIAPQDSEVLCNLGKYWQEMNRSDRAESFYLQALQVNPEDANTNARLGQYYQTLGDLNRARTYYEHAIQNNPDHAMSLVALGEIAAEQGSGSAEDFFLRGMKAGGSNDVALVRKYCKFLIGNVRYPEALALWRKLEQRYPAHPRIQLGLAEYFRETAEFDKAAEIYAQLTDTYPENTEFLFTWSEMEESRNNVELSVSLLKRAQEIEPDNPVFRLAMSKLLLRKKDYQAAIAEINRVDLDSLQNDLQITRSILFERARIYDQLKEYDQAFVDLEKANQVRSQIFGISFDLGQQKTELENDKQVFNHANREKLVRFQVGSDNKEVTPIFIVGFPRSGTTLLEQIVASHSKVSAGDELVFISEARNRINHLTNSQREYPFNLLDEEHPVTQDTLYELRKYYINRVKDKEILDTGSTMFTDKMPHNLANLGFISILFPEAPIIHITRHPMDACLSTFMADFKYSHFYTATMHETATHYALLMKQLENFKSVLDMKYLQIRYEDLLDEPEARIRDVLEFIGLPWEEACLNYHESKRVSRTASYAQVTQKIYTTSRYRYRNYYRHLDPYEPILREAINNFGYSFGP